MQLILSTAAVFVIVIFFGNFVFLLNNHDYTSEFQKLKVNETIANNVVDFVNGKSTLSSEFNSRESSHLEDVKNLFTAIKRFYYISSLILLIMSIYLFTIKKFNQIIPKSLIVSGAASLLLLFIIFLLSFSFTEIFNLIHKPFFASNTWIFPADSLLITTFPEQFFKDFAKNLFLLIFVNSAVFLGIGLFIRKKFKQRNKTYPDDYPS